MIAYAPAVLAGRCANGSERGRGRVIHAVAVGQAGDSARDAAAAVCGATYGPRSAGWSDANAGAALTCVKCLRLTAAPAVKKRKKEKQLEIEFLADPL